MSGTREGTEAAPAPCARTIAGSGSDGGAGIQADLKTFRAHGIHGLSVITAIASQSTRGVSIANAVPLIHIGSQLAAVSDDFPTAPVKTGMLGSAAITGLVARKMPARKPAWLVVDPVMSATSGVLDLRLPVAAGRPRHRLHPGGGDRHRTRTGSLAAFGRAPCSNLSASRLAARLPTRWQHRPRAAALNGLSIPTTKLCLPDVFPCR